MCENCNVPTVKHGGCCLIKFGVVLQVRLREMLFKLKELGERKRIIEYRRGMKFFLAAELLDKILFCGKIMIHNTAQNCVKFI